MNYLVFLDPCAGELEKILSGLKCMLVNEFDPVRTAGQPVSAGDSLYFLRGNYENNLRVKAEVTRVLYFVSDQDEDLSHKLKEHQPRLQLTEDQYNYWSTKQQVMFIEFDCAQKIEAIHVSSLKISDRSGWIAFKEFSEIT